MSGSFVSTGILTNEGKKISLNEINEIMKLKIVDLSIQIIPLYHNTGITFGRFIGRVFQDFIHPAIFSPTLSHIAIQLTLEKDFIVIMEYGQYYSEDSKIENTSIFSSFSKNSDSSQDTRKELNSLNYIYINKDGARLTILDKEFLKVFFWMINANRDDYASKCLFIIASNHYEIPLLEFRDNLKKSSSISDYAYVLCDINNKISLGELCNEFKGKNWEAKDYNVSSHNCQNFAAEIIKILKAVRINNFDKIRSNEKGLLPNCIISNLWDNENLSVVNTLGRMPIIGLLYDRVAFWTYLKKK